MLRGFQVFVSGVALVAVTLVGASTAAAQAPPAPAKPSLAISSDVALITVFVKPDKTADFEYVLGKLKDALNKSENPIRKQQAAGWVVYKTSQLAQGNAVYIMRIDPVVKDTEYAMSLLIAETFPTEAQEIFAKLKESFAGQGVSELTRVLSMQQ